MTVRPSVRFDVFKRDAFTCVYCGRRPPDVTLEVDHIIPIAEGGGDDPENLTTSCWDCNRGKGATPLDREPSTIPDIGERTELIREREAQLRAYHEAIGEQARRRDEQLTTVAAYWLQVWNETELPRYYTPSDSVLRRYIEELGPDEVMEAMRIARRKFDYLTTNAVRYFVGVLKGKQADRN